MAKRCRNCSFWNVYRGDEPTLPKRTSRACTQRGATYEGPNGDPKNLVTNKRDFIEIKDGKRTRVETEPGPHYGQRTKPNFVCAHFVGKHPPKLKATQQPDPQVEIEIVNDGSVTATEPLQEVYNVSAA